MLIMRPMRQKRRKRRMWLGHYIPSICRGERVLLAHCDPPDQGEPVTPSVLP